MLPILIIMSKDTLQKNALNSARVKIGRIWVKSNLDNKVNTLVPKTVNAQKID